ncbi:hypothetical protein LCGC14_2342530 [marine sediment metagenome]|uniref:Uncharacterized protein n=1 Tax=marine sediment metagenome TaxID=412755 RepID=A0A0F9CZ53_9ZZZZ
MRKIIQSCPSVSVAVLIVCLLAFYPAIKWINATDVWSGGRPITHLNDSTQTQINLINDEPHSPEEFCGANASPVFPTTAADADTMTPYVLTSGNDTWGGMATPNR